MRIQINRPQEQGSTLLITLVLISVLGTVMASYLELVSFQNRSTMRSVQWNSAIPILEAGVEEALTHLKYQGTNLNANAWQFVDDVYQKERSLGDSRYVVTISTDARPTIISRAYVAGISVLSYTNKPRAVKVTVTTSALFTKGMVAKGSIDLSGNNIATDSFDSSDAAFSTGGRYDATKAKDGGDVATNSTVTNSFKIGNANIYGKAATGPSGSISVGSNGAVGSKAWQSAGNKGFQPGWTTDDMNVQFPDVTAPFSGGASTPTSGTVNGTSYTYVIGNGNFQLASLSLSGQNKVIITGNAVLYVTGNISMAGQSTITIATNASLKLYMAGASATFNGNGIANPSANAAKFSYYGLPSNTSVSLGGNAAFTGTVYAPQAAFTMGGGGNNPYDFVGATVTDSVRLNGHFKFHYDEYLSRIGPTSGFVVDSWNEIEWEEL